MNVQRNGPGIYRASRVLRKFTRRDGRRWMTSRRYLRTTRRINMDYEEFLSIVEQQTDMGKPGLDRDEAQAATSVAGTPELSRQVTPECRRS